MADSRYVIEVAAEMSGHETLGELDALADKLAIGGKRSDDFQRAIKRLSTDLEAAKVVSGEAASALAAGADQYRTLERESLRASKALEKAQASGRFDPRAARAAYEASTALDKYAVTLKGLEDASAKASAKQSELSSQLAKANKLGAHADARFSATNQRLEKLQAAFGRIPGPIGAMGSKLVGTAKSANELKGVLPAAQLATVALGAAAAIAVVAVIALAAALVYGAVSATKYAVAQADAARQAALSREAFAALSAETAAGVSAFNAIALETGLADAELVALTKSLRDAEVSAADMPKALRAAALAERALGKGGAGEFVARIREGELAVEDFAQTAEAAFGGIVAEQIRGVDAQLTRAGKSWSKLFAGINIDPFLDALAVLTGMLEKGHPLADAFGGAIKSVLDPIGPLALKAAYAIEAFALGFAIELTKMYIAVKPALAWLGELFGFDAKGQGALDFLASLGKAFAYVAVVITGAMAAFSVLIAGVLAIPAMLAALPFTIYAVGKAITDGLVEGITSVVPRLIAAVSSAVTAAIDTAKSLLGIASPSKVFAEIGGYTAEGFAGGVDSGAGEAQGSMAALVSPEAPAQAAAQGVAQAQGAAGGGGPSKSFDFQGATFVFHGVANAETAKERFADMLTRILEDDAASLAGAEVPA